MACTRGKQDYHRKYEHEFRLPKCIHEPEEFNSNDEDIRVLQKPPEQPLMVYERASLFLEQFQENRKRNLHNVRKFDPEYIHDHIGKDVWAPKCNHYYNLSMPDSPLANFSQENCSGGKAVDNLNTKAIISKQKDDEIWQSRNLLQSPKKMICGQMSKEINDQHEECLRKVIASTAALSRTASNATNNKEKEGSSICIIVFVALLLVMLIDKVIDKVQLVLDYIKGKLAFYIIKSWTSWDMSSMIQKKESAKLALVCFSPLMAVIGAIYSCVWIAYTINKTFKSPVPDCFIRKFNFKQLFEQDSE